MSRNRPMELVQKHISDGVVPLGNYKIRPDGNNHRTAYPAQAARVSGVEQGDTVRMFVDQHTGAVVAVPTKKLEELRENGEDTD